MSVFAKIAIPMFCIAFAMFYLARQKQDKNYLIPGFVLLAAGVVNAVFAITAG
ncbi:hypothetical protein ORN12_03085 [Pantoea vagans]|uniref:hypothetical protein n=1 Tax=Pantoea vagans TaxID=470934 RepID=UPI00225518A5|nr:hypothetical protein [Pantoea vagans]MCX3307996.1 hypothetical protein [Pantoea vagans]